MSVVSSAKQTQAAASLQRWGSTLRYRYPILGAFLILAVLFSAMPAQSSTIPTFSIVSVVADQSVTVQTSNFPANENFVVTMGPMGTQGVNGIVVATTNSGAGGTFQATYTIPEQLRGSYQIAIRMQTAHAYPYFAFNWFYNNTSTGGPGTGNPGTGGVPGYTGIPTFSISAVQADTNVTIQTNNFPANQTFTITMGPMGTQGVNGIVVGTLNSGAGGALSATYNIPEQLRGSYQIAIRAQTSQANPYFAYNWFYNNTTAGSPGKGGEGSTTTPGYTGIPTFTVCSVTRDQMVTIRTTNFPPNQTFTVTMGRMGTQGINGIVVGTLPSGAGGQLTASYNIPAQLAGAHQIAIRAQTGQAYPFYAYNWFFNTTATVC